jgi:hypothetical protein
MGPGKLSKEAQAHREILAKQSIANKINAMGVVYVTAEDTEADRTGDEIPTTLGAL